MRVVRPRRGARVYVPGDTTFRVGTTDELSKRRTWLIRLLERRAPSDATVLLAVASCSGRASRAALEGHAAAVCVPGARGGQAPALISSRQG